MKGKDMVLSDFLSRQKHDDSNPHEIISISFNMCNVLYETYYRIDPQDRYQVQMQSQTKAIGVTLTKVHGTKKTLDMSTLLEIQKPRYMSNRYLKIDQS